MTMQNRGLVSAAVLIAALGAAGQAGANPITIGGATVGIGVFSDWNDWEWRFRVRSDKKVTSLHIRGLKGDVADPWEYEDFQPVSSSILWTVTTTTADSSINWQLASTPAALFANTTLFSFDSDYSLADELAAGGFQIGVDLDYGPVIWSDTITSLDSLSIGQIPLPAPALLLIGGIAALGAATRRSRR